MVHHTTLPKTQEPIVQSQKVAPTTKQIKTKVSKKDTSSRFMKPLLFGDIIYYEVGVSSWNQPEAEYMYNT
ncbi:glgB2 [Acrasis kona]|uniref:GlgB2 n=1 Tax=Acrasis kona TaxID=1008807 RepID=A0AAW2ZNS2_9EUKA